MADPITTLEEAAKARIEAVAEREAAQVALDELRPGYDAAVRRVKDAERRVKRLDQGMEGVRKAYAAEMALRELGIETDEPLFVVVEAHFESELPRVWHLVAVAGDGTGLYLSTPRRSHRYDGKRWAIRFERAPEGTAPERFERMRDAGLVYWDERGRGAWGAGSGSIKAKRAPDGGRWRHLKLREQAALPAGAG